MPLAEAVAATNELRELARLLGAECIEQEQGIRARKAVDPDVTALVDYLADAVVAVPRNFWTDGSTFEALLEMPPVHSRLDPLELLPPLRELGVLQGLCLGPLGDLFRETYDVIDLRFGDPFPVPDRPLPPTLVDPTPPFSTLDHTQLLRKTRFRLWEHPTGGDPRVRLDYRWRDELDSATWDEDAGTPRVRVASVHPHADVVEFDFKIYRHWWFDVRPKRPDPGAFLSHLEVAADNDADIAILPELSMQKPDALKKELASDYGKYPPLVVAGSAHVRTRENGAEVRANESHAYVNGIPLLAHRKCHPLEFEFAPPDVPKPRRMPEGLTEEPKVLTFPSGRRTRAAVVICADLNEPQIPHLLESAGVNLLLVPAMSARLGAFSTAVSQIAGHCQGYTVIVNGAPPPSKRGSDPFAIFTGVPESSPKRQTCEIKPPSSGRRAIGLFDLNDRRMSVGWIPL